MVDGKKMSKSEGNFYRLADLEEKYSDIPKELLYRAVRLVFVNGKYNDSIDFSFSKLEQAFNTLKKIDESLKTLSRSINT
jgi:cysteinyl-tRNA synthetase